MVIQQQPITHYAQHSLIPWYSKRFATACRFAASILAFKALQPLRLADIHPTYLDFQF
jgi:hypothetical protein